MGTATSEQVEHPRIRPQVWGVLLLGILLTLALISWETFKPMGTGSKRYAKEWTRRFQAISSPEEAQRTFPEVAVRVFESGDWVFGIGMDSHASPFGGTIVLKDSKGSTHSYFGHVCGPHFLRAAVLSKRQKSLTEVPQMLLNSGFQEYEVPE